VKKVLCSWESPFANCMAGAPGGDYLSRAIVKCSGAPIADTAFMGLTSCRWITIARTLARRQRVAQPASWSQPSTNVAALEAYNPALMSAEPSTDGQQQ
jgi:hypothetical protein